MSVRFDHPEVLWLLLLAAPIVLLGVRSLTGLEPHRRWTAVVLRVLVLVVLVLTLAGPQTVRTHSDLTTIAVVDQSESVRRFGQAPPRPGDGQRPPIDEWVTDYLTRAASDRRPTDRFGLVTFDERATVRSMPAEAVDLDPGTVETPVEGSDIAGSLRGTMAIYPPDTGARMVLVSDGNDTGGADEVLAAAREAAAANIPIDVLPITYRVGSEVMVEAVYAPTEAREGQTVAVRVVLRATAPVGGALQLLHDDVPVDLNGEAAGTGAPVRPSDWSVEELGDAAATGRHVAVKQIDLPLGYAGAHRFVAVFEPATPEADTMAANNRGEAFTLVQGRGRVLFVNHVEPPSGLMLPEALASQGIELDVVGAGGIPATLTGLQRYDAVVLQNVPADFVPPTQQRTLAQYVNNLGGGLIMIGGPESFGAGGWANSPIDGILPVESQIPSQTVLPSGALVVVMDRSGSMLEPVQGRPRSKQEVANEAAALAVGTLFPQDLVGVVAFDAAANWVVPLQLNSDAPQVMRRIRSIQSDGGTNIYAGLELAYESLRGLTMQDAAIRHVILLTDGDSAPPPGGSWDRLMGDFARAGITVSTVGVGDGHNRQVLTQLAALGGGQYHPIDNPDRLPQVFVKEAKTIRRNLIREGTFTPRRVQFSPVLASMAQLPPLRGLVLTAEKRHPLVTTALVGPDDEPVFAHWQVGLGRSAAFTSDATNRWASQWLEWGGYADFWTRLVRLVARPSAVREADLLTTIEGDRLRIRLDAAAVDAEVGRDGARGGAGSGVGGESGFANFLRVRGTVLRPDGTTEDVELAQTGPGLYEAATSASQTGSYLVTLFAENPVTGERRSVFGGASRAAGRELRRFESNLGLLEQVAEITGGRVLDPGAAESAGLFERTRPFESRSVRPVWRLLLPWVLALVLLDVASRRLAWDPVAAWGKVRALTAAAGEPREARSEATLAALRQKRGEVVATTREGAGEVEPPPRPRPRRRVRVAQPAEGGGVAKPQAAAGGATAEAGGVAKPQAAAGEGAGVTNRLLAAKRRAREQREHRDDH